MKDYGTEEVLGLPRNICEDILANEIQSGQLGLTAFWQVEDEEAGLIISDLTSNASFMSRTQAETDVEFKQIIPYCLVVYSGKDGDLILHYSRAKDKSPEARLAGKRSIGVGGHINPEDFETNNEGPEDHSYMIALYRELKEEIGIDRKSIQDFFTIGFVNDEENEVGQVHIGVVHVVVLNTTTLGDIEENLNDPRWDTPQEIFLEQNLETWSEMVLKGLREKIEQNPWHLSRTS